MAKTEEGHTIVEGDASAVPVQIAPGEAADSPRRPDKGAQLVWGGSGPSSPWGNLLSLVGAAGGSVQYTLFHSTVLAQLAKGKKPNPPKPASEEKKQDDDAHQAQHDQNTSYVAPAEAPAGNAGDPLFDAGHLFEYDNKGKKDARLWAHPAAPFAKKVPLLVFLHGIAPTKLEGMDCDYPQLQSDFAAHPFGCHLGHLARALVNGGKVRPIAVAAPTAHDNKSSTHLWRVFDLGKLVQRVAEELASLNAGFEIDPDEVILAGHSGAGCDGSNGLYKVAKEHGEFKDKDGGTHQLRALGFADTCANEGLAAIARMGLKNNPKTAVYAMFKGGGGGGQAESAQLIQSYGAGYGATKLHAGGAGGPEDPREFDDFRDNDGASPARISAHFSEANANVERTIYAHEQEWIAAGAIASPWPKKGQKNSGWADHYAMPLVWTFWALQRFCAARAEDREILNQQRNGQPADHHGDDDPARKADPPAGRPGPDWENVPAGPPAWHAPAARPRTNAPARFADPISGRFWPVRTRSSYGRAVAFVGDDGHGYGAGPASDPTGQRHFLAERRFDRERWYNGGVDLYADFGDTVVAAEEGTIVRFEPLYSGVNKLMVRCTSGLVVHYGGVDPDSLQSLGLEVSGRVRAGQPIAHVGRRDGGQPVLHFETYPEGTKDVAALLGTGNLTTFLDPTAYLLHLAVHGQ